MTKTGVTILWILCILIGLCLGQPIKIAVSPELQAISRHTWTVAQAEAPKIKASSAAAAKRIKASATKRNANKALEGVA